MTAREYVVGLPVVITVADDGTVTYEVDLSEAGSSIFEACNEEALETDDDTIVADRERIEQDYVDHFTGARPLVYRSIR